MSNEKESLTTAPVTAPEVINTSKPEFIRLPRPRQRCERTGLSRTTLCELILPTKKNQGRPPVRSITMRQRGKARGVRLIDYASLLRHLNSCGLVESGEVNHET